MDLERLILKLTNGSFPETKVSLRSGAGRSLADRGHVTQKRLRDTAVERDSSRNRHVWLKIVSLLVHTKQILFLKPDESCKPINVEKN